jgi:hypothetical protein
MASARSGRNAIWMKATSSTCCTRPTARTTQLRKKSPSNRPMGAYTKVLEVQDPGSELLTATVTSVMDTRHEPLSSNPGPSQTKHPSNKSIKKNAKKYAKKKAKKQPNQSGYEESNAAGPSNAHADAQPAIRELLRSATPKSRPSSICLHCAEDRRRRRDRSVVSTERC